MSAITIRTKHAQQRRNDQQGYHEYWGIGGQRLPRCRCMSILEINGDEKAEQDSQRLREAIIYVVQLRVDENARINALT
jgi:hypothetical protein